MLGLDVLSEQRHFSLNYQSRLTQNMNTLCRIHHFSQTVGCLKLWGSGGRGELGNDSDPIVLVLLRYLGLVESV